MASLSLPTIKFSLIALTYDLRIFSILEALLLVAKNKRAVNQFKFKDVAARVSLLKKMISACWELESCPVSIIKKRPLLGGCLSTGAVVISISNRLCH